MAMCSDPRAVEFVIFVNAVPEHRLAEKTQLCVENTRLHQTASLAALQRLSVDPVGRFKETDQIAECFLYFLCFLDPTWLQAKPPEFLYALFPPLSIIDIIVYCLFTGTCLIPSFRPRNLRVFHVTFQWLGKRTQLNSGKKNTWTCV
jgi:hypothetical protein